MRDGAIRISVGGGKGGTGKSTVALNLGIALARLGMRTVLVDADLGAANLHTMLGIERLPRTLQSLVDKDIDSLEEAVVSTCEPRLALVPGVGAVVGGANPAHAQKLKLLRHVCRLDADVVVVDVGAGTSYNALDFFELGDHRLVVTTAQLTSIQNAYSFLKNAVHRAIRAAARNDHERAILASSSERAHATERLAGVLARVSKGDPLLGARACHLVAGFSASVVANQLEPGGAANVAHALSRMLRDFLTIEAPVRAMLPASASVNRSVTLREPHLRRSPDDPFSRAIGALAEQLLAIDVGQIRARRACGLPSPAAPEQPAEEPREGDFRAMMAPHARRDERVSVELGAVVRSGPRSVAGCALDLSPRGVRVRLPLPLEKGDRVEVTIAGRGPFGGVVRHATAAIGETFDVGIELDSDAEPHVRALVGPRVVDAPVLLVAN